MESKFLSLKQKDFIKGLIVTIISAAIATLTQIIDKAGLNLNKEDFYIIATAGVTAGLAYLTKNFLTNSEDKILTPENK